MVPKTRIVITGIIAIGLLVYAAMGIAGYFSGSEDRRMQGLGNEIVERINAFRVQEKRLPRDLTEIGAEEGSRPMSGQYKGETFYYSVWNDSIFIIEYAIDEQRHMSRFSNSSEWDVNYVVNFDNSPLTE